MNDLKPTDNLKMNIRQRRFVAAYAASGDPVAAVAQAGYRVNHRAQARNTAWRILQNPAVRAKLEELQVHFEDEMIADGKEIKMALTELIRGPATETKYFLQACKLLLQSQGELDPLVRMKIESTVTEQKEITYTFQGLPGPPGYATQQAIEQTAGHPPLIEADYSVESSADSDSTARPIPEPISVEDLL